MRRSTTAVVPRIATLMFLLVAAGCGGDGRLGVSGSVTVDGKPLDNGIISFQPKAGTLTHSAGTAVQAGEYRIAADKGLKPGEYQVRIQAFRKTGRMVEDPQFGRIEKSVPVDFQEARSLLATVSASGDNRFDFALHSKTR